MKSGKYDILPPSDFFRDVDIPTPNFLNGIALSKHSISDVLVALSLKGFGSVDYYCASL